jgi:acetyl esterase/lipase
VGRPYGAEHYHGHPYPFLPKPGKANGAAVIVAPGGGFRWLSMGNEGWEVAQALAEKGIAAFVLKYRLHPTPESLDDFKAWMNRPRPDTSRVFRHFEKCNTTKSTTRWICLTS